MNTNYKMFHEVYHKTFQELKVTIIYLYYSPVLRVRGRLIDDSYVRWGL